MPASESVGERVGFSGSTWAGASPDLGTPRPFRRAARAPRWLPSPRPARIGEFLAQQDRKFFLHLDHSLGALEIAAHPSQLALELRDAPVALIARLGLGSAPPLRQPRELASLAGGPPVRQVRRV